MFKKGLDESFLTFSFRGRETYEKRTLDQQIVDLEELTNFLVNEKKAQEIKIIPTSAGVVSAVHLLTSIKLGKYLSYALLLDPADYYLKDMNTIEDVFCWSGYEEFELNNAVSADLLKNIKSNVLVDVVHFTLRNYGPDGYSPHPGVDDPNYFPRLNTDMVKNFYDKTPKVNRGKYLEVGGIPHAFLRDGNVKENEKKVADLIFRLLKKNN